MYLYTRGLMDLQVPDLRGLRQTELWDTRPRGLHQVLPNLVRVGPQEAPLQEPLELHHQEVLLPSVPGRPAKRSAPVAAAEILSAP